MIVKLNLYPIDIQELIIKKYIKFNTFKCCECNDSPNYFSIINRKCDKCFQNLCFKHYKIGCVDAKILNKKYNYVCSSCFWLEII